MADSSHVAVQYSLPDSLPEWELPEVPVPESPEHDEVADHLRALLVAWLARTRQTGAVRRNLAIRWDRQNTKVGVDPDVCWLDALPPGWSDGEIDSLRLWMPGHRVPRLAIEIVSRHHPYKDYGKVQDKYAVVGVDELWVYDPRRFGPRSLGGPVLLQVWNRTPTGILVRRHFGDEPAHSALMGAWLVPREADHLVIAEDAEGAKPWKTVADAERARADALDREVRRLRERER